MTKVSVIIPAYNAEPYITQCAYSVLHQTLDDIEIIFIDDGSTDRTGIILDQITKDCDNTLVVHQNNKGLYESRKRGLSLATGEYIGWIDADDYVETNIFELLYNIAIENDSELVICDYSWFPEKIKTKGKWFREYTGIIDTTFVERNTQPWNKIVKRELLERLDIGSQFVTCLDEIYIRILLEAKNPVTVKQPLYHYRVGAGTMSSSYTDVNHYEQFVKASKELRRVMQSVITDSYWKDYFDNRISYYILMTMVVAANAGNKEKYEKHRYELRSITPKYSHNQHWWKILRNNYGLLKAFAIGVIVPTSYLMARLACKVGFR